MRVVARGEVWMVDFGLVAKVRPALLLTGGPAEDELDIVTVLLHTTALRGNRWELTISKPFLKFAPFICNRYRPSRQWNWNGNLDR